MPPPRPRRRRRPPAQVRAHDARELLNSTPVFRRGPFSWALGVAEWLRPMHVFSKEVIIREGVRGESLYFVQVR